MDAILVRVPSSFIRSSRPTSVTGGVSLMDSVDNYRTSPTPRGTHIWGHGSISESLRHRRIQMILNHPLTHPQQPEP